MSSNEGVERERKKIQGRHEIATIEGVTRNMRVTAVTSTEWQKDWAASFVYILNAAKNTHNTSKTGNYFKIDCTTRFDKKSEVYFNRLLKAKAQRTKWISAIPRNNWTPGSQRWICSYHFVNNAEFSGKIIPYFVFTTHQLNIYHFIFCTIGCFF